MEDVIKRGIKINIGIRFRVNWRVVWFFRVVFGDCLKFRGMYLGADVFKRVSVLGRCI